LESFGSTCSSKESDCVGGKGSSPEQYSSLWARATFAWLSSTFWKGHRNVISLDDLPPFDTKLKSEELCRQLTLTWASYDHRARHSLLRACLRTYLASFLSPTLPRLCLIAFLFTQPFLVSATLNHIGSPDADSNHGWGLIGAWALVYLGIAVSLMPFPSS
jgi:hypothetical protein